MFKLLLDEHIFPGIAEQVKKKLPQAKIESLHSWNHARLLQQSDERILLEARQEGWTLLTFDLATIPPLLSQMRAVAADHAGVIFVSRKSFAQNDYGGLVSALVSSWAGWKKLDWKNQMHFLSRG